MRFDITGVSIRLNKMKTHAYLKMKGTTRVNHQQVMDELKQRVVFALNKLADNDTYQIDTDSEQKSVVRKECIRWMGVLVTKHEGIVGPHLGKMVASIVKRLKEQDAVVRDACVETIGVLTSKLSNDQGENDGIFVALVKPLFEASGEQNKQVQAGAALCLAHVIYNTNDPPVSILQRMLTRTIKLLENPHFMAKSAVIELNRIIIQAGGAPAQSNLSSAMSGIQEAVKNSDWTTRKAASLSLGEIASSGGSFFSSFKSSCIRSLESCWFDKVKPVRDTVLQALHLWRSLPGHDPPEPSEAGSSIKGVYKKHNGQLVYDTVEGFRSGTGS
ncbi:Microtubule-associated protein [Actinidia chinensis var. chinensis]|uniref:Microtubule-associated protein n=1 Tax=Actinidia chinensis var. chinensis TaxID=1590841 RepID=A0A2R6R3Y9_ACTCC|nr:Microtubule-associated protein [Actinidia chinensis var. chinensis]